MKLNIFFLIVIFSLLFITACNKEKGRIVIHDVTYEIQNCKLPYIVKFVSDLTYKEGDVEFIWDFGDGQTSRSRNPINIYKEKGIYNVKLTVNNYDKTEEINVAVDIRNESIPVIADFDYETIYNYYAPAEIKFRNTSVYESSILWNFGDGFGSNDTVTSHIYENPGEYDLVLSAICGDDTVSVTTKIKILPPPENIAIKRVSIWMPSQHNNKNIDLKILYDIFDETPNTISTINAGSYPVHWNMYEELFFFDGDYNEENLQFEIYEHSNNFSPIATFAIPTYRISELHYPNILTIDNGNGYSAEIALDYK